MQSIQFEFESARYDIAVGDNGRIYIEFEGNIYSVSYGTVASILKSGLGIVSELPDDFRIEDPFWDGGHDILSHVTI